MRSFLIAAVIFLSACVSEPLPDGFKASSDFDPIAAAKNRISLGLTYLKNGNFSQAKFNLDKALQFAPRLADAHFSMAYYYQQVDEVSLADEAYQKALAFDPKNPDIANSYGAFLCANGQYDEAKTYFLEAVNSTNYISTAETYENLALCSQSQGEMEDALTYLQSSLNHQPSRAKALRLLVELQMEQQQWEDAKSNLRRLEKNSRVTADTLWMSIVIEQALGNTELAKGYGDMLISMYPTHQNTLTYIKNRENLANIVSSRTVSSENASNQTVTRQKTAQQKVIKQLKPDTDTIAQVATKSDPNTSVGDAQENDKAVTTIEQPEINGPQQGSASTYQDDYPIEATSAVDNSEKQVDVVADSSSEKKYTSQNMVDKEFTEEHNLENYHVVEKGENLYRISLKYNVKMQRLIDWNELPDASSIFVGKKLIVIDPQAVEQK